MTKLGSKAIAVHGCLEAHREKVLAEVADFLQNNPVAGDLLVRVSVESAVAARLGKIYAEAAVRKLSAEGKVWEWGDYRFVFGEKYYWKGEPVYLTPGEALFFYRCLVLKEFDPWRSDYIRNARNRLGKDFLADVDMRKG
jgi:hypothetical protein